MTRTGLSGAPTIALRKPGIVTSRLTQRYSPRLTRGSVSLRFDIGGMAHISRAIDAVWTGDACDTDPESKALP